MIKIEYRLKPDFRHIAFREFHKSDKANEINYIPVLGLFIRLLKHADKSNYRVTPFHNGPEMITTADAPVYNPFGNLSQINEYIKWLHFNWFLTAQFPKYHNVWELSFNPIYFDVVEIETPVKRNGVPALSFNERQEIHDLFNHTCVYCGAESEEIDHVIPVSRGGTNDKSNLVASCVTCNRTKSDRMLEEIGWDIEQWQLNTT